MAEKKLIVAPAAWSDDAAEMLQRAAHDPLIGINTLRAIVESERGALFEVVDDGALRAAYVLQVNQCEHGAELVLVAAAGDMPGVSLTRAIVPFIESQGRQCDRVRISAGRPGLVRVLSRMGFSWQSSTMVKARHVF